MAQVESGIAKLALQRVAGIFVLPRTHQPGEAVQSFFIEAQRLADLARGGASAIGNDVGGHGRAELAVALVDILDGLLALIAAGQVEIDVGPLAALFREKALEEQLHADGIDRGDAERITDRAVGRRAASLHQDVLLAAVLHDVPDDEEISGELELLDQRQLAFDLAAGALPEFALSGAQITIARAFLVRSRRKESMVSPSATG